MEKYLRESMEKYLRDKDGKVWKSMEKYLRKNMEKYGKVFELCPSSPQPRL